MNLLNFKNIKIAIFASLIVYVFFLQKTACSQKERLEEKENQINVLIDSAKTYRDKQGFLHIEVKKLEGSRKDLLKIIEAKDKELLAIAKDKKTNTIIKYKDKVVYSDSIVLLDTCNIDTTIGDEWVKLSLNAQGTTLKTKLEITNKYTIVDKWKRDKWYKKKYNVVDVKIHNPYAVSDSLVQYTIKPKKCRLFNLLR